MVYTRQLRRAGRRKDSECSECTTEQLLQDGSSASVSRAPARGSAAGSPVHAPRERSRRRHRREMVLVAEPLGAAPGSIEPGLRACTVVGGAVAAQTGNRRHVLVAAGVRRCVPAVEPGRVVAELGEPRLDARDLWGASVDARPRSKKGVLWASSLDARRGGSTQLKTQSTSSPAVATADAFRSSPASPNHAAMAARPGRPRKALRAAACVIILERPRVLAPSFGRDAFSRDLLDARRENAVEIASTFHTGCSMRSGRAPGHVEL